MNPKTNDVTIDAVYTWVDSSSASFGKLFEKTLASLDPRPASDVLQPFRFRQSDELRYSLRSLEQFAPWIRTVHLVTNGEYPAWLNSSSPRIRQVSHESIFKVHDNLPTFNSNAIEMHLHRIPGLSRKFLYLNDDLFIGRTCTPGDFTFAKADISYFESIKLPQDLDPQNTGDLACASTLQVLAASTLGAQITFMPAHVPQLYDREWLAELEARFPVSFARTAAKRFRSPDDLILRIAYAALALEKGNRSELLLSGNSDYSLVRMKPGILQNLRDFKTVLRNRPRFFCINDELPSDWSAQLACCLMQRFLQRYFPQPSAFEIG